MACGVHLIRRPQALEEGPKSGVFHLLFASWRLIFVWRRCVCGGEKLPLCVGWVFCLVWLTRVCVFYFEQVCVVSLEAGLYLYLLLDAYIYLAPVCLRWGEASCVCWEFCLV